MGTNPTPPFCASFSALPTLTEGMGLTRLLFKDGIGVKSRPPNIPPFVKPPKLGALKLGLELELGSLLLLLKICDKLMSPNYGS